MPGSEAHRNEYRNVSGNIKMKLIQHLDLEIKTHPSAVSAHIFSIKIWVYLVNSLQVILLEAILRLHCHIVTFIASTHS